VCLVRGVEARVRARPRRTKCRIRPATRMRLVELQRRARVIRLMSSTVRCVTKSEEGRAMSRGPNFIERELLNNSWPKSLEPMVRRTRIWSLSTATRIDWSSRGWSVPHPSGCGRYRMNLAPRFRPNC
jgi:hypothetical protein